MTDVNETEIELLKSRANSMGISYHPSIGISKLREKIAEVMEPTVVTKLSVGKETNAQVNARLRRDANKLVRLRLTCMNPAKKNWPGEVFSVGNSHIGWIKKFVPFEAEDGWHIPAAIVEVLKERKYTQFYTVTAGQQKIKKSRPVKEFAIEILPDLSVEELKTLATKQTAERVVG